MRAARLQSRAMDVSHLLDALNPAQRDAVTAAPAHYLVLAGAGSGKTRVLVHRIAWLTEVLGFSPWGVLAVTFTNKAAGEMRGRAEALMPRGGRGLTVGTFHGIAHRWLRQHWREAGLAETFQILDADDQQRLVKRTLGALGVDEARFPPRQATWFINNAKDEGKRPDRSGLQPGHAHADRRLPRLRGRLPARGPGRLRRAAAAPARAVAAQRRAARALPRPLRAPAGRRVPGHQHDPVRVRAPARRG